MTVPPPPPPLHHFRGGNRFSLLLGMVKDLLDRVDIWTLEGELAFANMLDLAINENTAPKSLALIALDLSQPWTLVETLQKWIKVLENHLDARSLRDEKSEGLGVPLLVVVNKVRPPPPARPPAGSARHQMSLYAA